MKKIFFLICSIFITARAESTDCIGPQNAKHAAVYLHGIDSQTPGDLEIENRKILKSVAQNLNIRIALPRAQGACPTESNLLCWGWDFNDSKLTENILQRAYQAAQNCFPKNKKVGLIGFSNGGFVVHQIVKDCRKTKFSWFVSIGAGGWWNRYPFSNLSRCGPLRIIIGINDEANYKNAFEFQDTLRSLNANSKIIESDSGHLVPSVELEIALREFIK